MQTTTTDAASRERAMDDVTELLQDCISRVNALVVGLDSERPYAIPCADCCNSSSHAQVGACPRCCGRRQESVSVRTSQADRLRIITAYLNALHTASAQFREAYIAALFPTGGDSPK